MIIQQGSNPTFDVQVVDDTGLGVTGLVAATMPALSYRIAGPNAAVAFPTLNDLALITTAYNAGGIKELSGGYYRVDGPTGIAATVNTQVRIIGEASGKHVICPPLEICPAMGLVAGAIDLPTFTAIAKELLGSGWLATSATTTPATTGNWYRSGIYNGEPTWANDTSPAVAWYDLTNTRWVITATVGTLGSNYYATGSGSKVNGTYTGVGTTTGVPVVTAHGNAFLGGFQPEQTLPSSAQVGTLPTSGTINTTTPPTAVAIRTEMDANSTKLANLDVTVSSRLATAGYTAPTTPPTAVAIRTEMDANSTKLANLDATVSSRLATSGYTAPPTAAANRIEMDASSVKLNQAANNSGGGSITNYVTVPAAVANASQNPATIVCLRGDTCNRALPLAGSLASRTKLVMTAKAALGDPDSAAVFQVVEGTGLTILNGVATSDSTSTLTVTNPTTGAINLTLNAAITKQFDIRDLVWDCQVILPGGISSPIGGVFSVTADVTQATS